MNRQIAECHEMGLRLIFDPGQQVTAPDVDLAAGVGTAEVVFVNEYELGVLCEKTGMSAAELKAKVPILITTKGKDGSVIEGHKVESALSISIATPVKVADPTGAGDAYRSGFLYGYLRQWDLIDCGRLGSVVASFIVEQQGTQQHFSTEAVIERYHRTFNTEVTL